MIRTTLRLMTRFLSKPRESGDDPALTIELMYRPT